MQAHMKNMCFWSGQMEIIVSSLLRRETRLYPSWNKDSGLICSSPALHTGSTLHTESHRYQWMLMDKGQTVAEHLRERPGNMRSNPSQTVMMMIRHSFSKPSLKTQNPKWSKIWNLLSQHSELHIINVYVMSKLIKISLKAVFWLCVGLYMKHRWMFCLYNGWTPT